MYLESRIKAYLCEQFLSEVLTEQTFTDYKTGLIAGKKKGWRDIIEEAEYHFYSMKAPTMQQDGRVQWDRND